MSTTGNRLSNRTVRPEAPQQPDTPFRRTTPRGPTPKPERIKRTFHLDKDKVLLLEQLQLTRFQQTGQKPELSSLAGEAIAMLSAAGTPETQAS